MTMMPGDEDLDADWQESHEAGLRMRYRRLILLSNIFAIFVHIYFEDDFDSISYVIFFSDGADVDITNTERITLKHKLVNQGSSNLENIRQAQFPDLPSV